MVSEARTGLGGLDGLVVNVGIVGGWGLEHTSAEDWDRVFQINVRAHYLTCKHALAVMPDGAAIVLTSSVAALMPANEVVAYHSSKAALDGLCMWLAKHAAARGIRVNIVVPGLIDTSLGRLAGKADPSREERPIPLGRQGTAWEVAYAAAFLLSDEASYITGHALLVDGGLRSPCADRMARLPYADPQTASPDVREALDALPALNIFRHARPRRFSLHPVPHPWRRPARATRARPQASRASDPSRRRTHRRRVRVGPTRRHLKNNRHR